MAVPSELARMSWPPGADRAITLRRVSVAAVQLHVGIGNGPFLAMPWIAAWLPPTSVSFRNVLLPSVAAAAPAPVAAQQRLLVRVLPPPR